MSAKFSQILKVIAQQTTQTTTTPTEQQTVVVPGNPTTFDPYAYWPDIITGWGSQNTNIIKQLSNIVNWCIFILSNGQLDMNKLRGSNFSVDPSKYPDRYLIMFVKLAMQFYRLIYTNLGAAYAVVIQNAPQRLQILKQALTPFPDGSINTQLANKVGGSPKTLILNLLNQIK